MIVKICPRCNQHCYCVDKAEEKKLDLTLGDYLNRREKQVKAVEQSRQSPFPGWEAALDQFKKDFEKYDKGLSKSALPQLLGEALHKFLEACEDLRTRGLVPEDWKLVPKYATWEMATAEWDISLSDAHSPGGVSESVWATMIDKSPTPPEGWE